MITAETKRLPVAPDVMAPDGSEVRVLLACAGGSMAHFQLPAGQVSRAVRHRSVDEIWYILSGHGDMWRDDGQQTTITPLSSGTCLTIPRGTRFQFRAGPTDALAVIAVTMPPWPGEAEAQRVDGVWTPTVSA